MRIQIKSIPIVPVLVLSLFAASCDDILDVEPKDKITADNYFKKRNSWSCIATVSILTTFLMLQVFSGIIRTCLLYLHLTTK